MMLNAKGVFLATQQLRSALLFMDQKEWEALVQKKGKLLREKRRPGSDSVITDLCLSK